MKKHIVLRPLLICCFILISLTGFCQSSEYWQQQVNYDIAVTLDDTDHTLDGTVKIEYFNNSPDTLHFIWFHLWPNAYKNDRTAYTDQDLRNRSTDFYFSDEIDRGYINRLNFKVDDVVSIVEDHPQHQDIIKIVLPKPLPPRQKINITTPFHIKLPYNFSRGGHIAQSYQITQWYPKPAVYDRKGWHPMPYLDLGEFYSEFGNYKVNINLPSTYVVASTGVKKNEAVTEGIKSITYEQDNVHDFAWFADKDFLVLHDTLQLPSKVIDVYAYHLPKSTEEWSNSLQYIKNAVLTKSKWIGEYPYSIVSVVERPGKDVGGMEYPTITLVSTSGSTKMLDYVINHEVGHNWFYGILASNERIHPWMDEGMNSYYDRRYNLQQYGREGIGVETKAPFINKRVPDDMEELLLRTVISLKKDQPIETPSAQLSVINYGLISYSKAAQWMQLLEKEMGSVAFENMMQAYYERWKFKHPYPEDFKAIAVEKHGSSLDSVFNLLHTKGSLQPAVKKSFKVMPFFSLKETDKYNYIFIAPAVGYNFYDKLMIGGIIHNYTAPPYKLQFFAAPLYATGSKQLNGIGRVGYSLYPGSSGQRLEFSISGAKFNGDSFTDSTNTIHYLDFRKLVPSIKYTLANRDPGSAVSRYMQWKTFLIKERSYLFTRDNTLQQYVITYPLYSRYVHQLNFVIENNRKLYPHKGILQVENGKGFFKAGFTGNYFFNYAKGGGLNARLFAGKFFYTGDKQNSFETYQYHFNMSGANGYEDYTYSNYFIGRSEFEGLLSQQMMIRDGGFKVRTDLLSNKYGRSDNWLGAVNFTTTIPKNVFPLPIKLFADVGTYAEAWEKDAPTGKFIYDAGIQISLLKNIINIYIPVLYSKEYRDYFKSYVNEKKFKKSISFSIDIHNLSFAKLSQSLF